MALQESPIRRFARQLAHLCVDEGRLEVGDEGAPADVIAAAESHTESMVDYHRVELEGLVDELITEIVNAEETGDQT